jgi:alpha-ketoglutaric semialdehyde dehydrogenase
MLDRAAARGDELASGWAASLTMGAGQFCTNPGIAVVIAGDDASRFINAAASALEKMPAQTMLTDGIAEAYRSGRNRVAKSVGVQEVLTSVCDMRNATPYLYQTTGDDWLKNHELGEEVFGPLGMVVTVRDFEEMLTIAKSLQGQLTCTLHMDAGDTEKGQSLMPIWSEKQAAFSQTVSPQELRYVMQWCMADHIQHLRTLATHLLEHYLFDVFCVQSVTKIYLNHC